MAPGKWQSYSKFHPVTPDECLYFIHLNDSPWPLRPVEQADVDNEWSVL